jgi:1-acyl-sn-glycerol-3-phosphate acyltransferase
MWGAVPVAREGRDMAAVRAIMEFLQKGRSVGIAAEGRRSRTGRLGPMQRVLVRIAVNAACRGVPVVPVVALGTYEALPPGAWFPRPHTIRVIVGDPIALQAWCGRKMDESSLEEASSLIQVTLAQMLPPERRPLPGTPAVSSLATEAS